MPATKKRPTSRTRKMSKTDRLAKELKTVKDEIARLQEHYRRMNRTLVHLYCPKEWLTDEVDDDELWAKGVEIKSFDDWIAKLSKQSHST